LYLNNNFNTYNMIAANYSEFRTGLKKFLDEVEDNKETLIIKRGSGNGAVLISLDEYNSIMETVHLLSSKSNADRLYESIKQIKEGQGFEKRLIEVK
jgi:antitoxin YefM